MRFTSTFFVALASAGSAVAQLGSNSTTTATSGSLTSSALTTTTITDESSTGTSTGTQPTGTTGPPVEVGLDNAQLGPGASKTTIDGKVAILLSPGANGQASFSVDTPALPEGVTIGDLISILFDTLVQALEASRKRADTDCTLVVTVNGQPVYNQALETSDGLVSQSTDGTPATGEQNIAFVQSCGANPASLTVANVEIAAGNGGGSTSTAVSPTGTPTGSGSLTSAGPTGNGTTSGTATGTGSVTGSITGTATGSGSVTGSATATSTSGPIASGFPASIGDFALFGCVGSTDNFPSFELIQTSGSMDLNACAGFCEGRSFFGVFDTDCYCGDVIDDSNTARVDLDLCDIECPGDDAEFCGGRTAASLFRRQSAPSNILLTVYVFVGGAQVTTTATTTSTVTTTVSGVVSTVTAIYECFDGKCYLLNGDGAIIVFIFNPFPGEECDGLDVFVIESCSCKGGQQYVPKHCSNGSCNGLTVYKAEECHDWYNQKEYYTPSNEGGKVVYKPWENTWGTPEKPNVPEVPSCSGPGCPVAPTSSPKTPKTTGGSKTPDVVVGAGSKQVVSGVAYVAALAAAFL